jgi:hypothetical protein
LNNIPSKLLKEDTDLTANIVCNLQKKIGNRKKILEKWRKGLLFKLRKKDNVLNCSNCRGIIFLSAISKIFS